MKEAYIRIRLTSEEKAKVREEAEKRNMTMTEYILHRTIKNNTARK